MLRYLIIQMALLPVKSERLYRTLLLLVSDHSSYDVRYTHDHIFLTIPYTPIGIYPKSGENLSNFFQKSENNLIFVLTQAQKGLYTYCLH